MDSEWRTHARWPDVPSSWSGRPAAGTAGLRRRRLLVTAALLGAFLLGLAAATWGGRNPAPVAAAPGDLTTPETARPAAPAVTTEAPRSDPGTGTTAATTTASPAATIDPAGVLDDVYRLPVADGSATGGYDRSRFGAAWADTDGNGCDTRDDVLRRDLRTAVTAPGDPCTVVSGTLTDPYGGTTVSFERGATSADVQIDHVVSLADAWRSGAATWSDERRVAFANDELNLRATTAQQNRAKSDADAADWLPASGACAYVAEQVAVKAKYALTVTARERTAIVTVLASCGCAQTTG